MDVNTVLNLIEKLRTSGQELRNIDAKRQLSLREMGDKAEFVKDVAAMANNNEPSYIIIGLHDGTFEDVGPLEYHHKTSDINQLLVDKIDPPVVVDYNEFTLDDREYAIVEIIGRNPPYIIARDLIHNKTDRKQVRIYKGMIFVRHQDRTEGISRSELDQVLQRKGLLKVFEDESEEAQQLVSLQPMGWEYLLTAELMRTHLINIRRKITDLHRGVHYVRAQRLRGSEFMNWIGTKFDDLRALLVKLTAHINDDFTIAWGEPGVPGDPLVIKRAVDDVTVVCDELVQWEADLRSVTPPQAFLQLRQLMQGWTLQIIDELERMPKELRAIMSEPNPSGQFNIALKLDGPANVDQFIAEVDRLQARPHKWINDY